MIRADAALVALLAVLGAGTAARADTILFANLTPGQEVTPPTFTTISGAPRPASSGTATLSLNDAMTALTFTATIINIDLTGLQTADPNDDLMSAHIHAPAPFGQNGPAVWGFFGTPFNDTNPNDTVLTPSTTGVGGTISSKWDLSEGNNTTLAAQIPNILAGRAYLNFHTAQNPGGEIRGQIIIPEPASLALFGIGMAALLALRPRRRPATRPR